MSIIKKELQYLSTKKNKLGENIQKIHQETESWF